MSANSYTTESVLASLGYNDPLEAARQYARIILLGRAARYQAVMMQFENKWKCTLVDLRTRCEARGKEDPAVDDDYLEWQWYADAADTVKTQLDVVTRS